MAKMDGSWLLVGSAVFILCLQPQACQSTENTTINDSEAVKAYLDGVATEVVQPELSDTLSSVSSLIEALQALQTDLASDERLDGAQTTLRATLFQWQRMEVLQIGAMASSLNSDVGEDLRDDIYSWPLVNDCRIDQVTASQAYLEENFLTDSLVSVRGLDAIGYLLSASAESSCPSQVPPVSDGAWAQLDSQEIQQRRVDYALVLAEGVQETLLYAQTQWQAGFPYALYDSQSVALNDVFNAMLYVEEMVKDRKLAHPMGLQAECNTDCYADVETGEAVAYLRTNLDSFERLFTLGVDNGGMVNVLNELGEVDIAEEILGNTQLTIQALDDLENPLSSTIQDSPSDVEAVLDTLSIVTDSLKWDLAAVLRLEIPDSTAGDND